MEHCPRLVIIGPPGSGKGTHARALAARWSIPHVSTGALLRREIDAKTEVGRRVADTVRAGGLVADELIVELVERALAEAPAGWILDGAPRTTRQADLLASRIEDQTAIVISLEVAPDELRRRLSLRRDEEGRADDAADVVEERLALWAQTGPLLIDRYARSGLLVGVDAAGTIAETSARVLRAVDEAVRARGGDNPEGPRGLTHLGEG